jgi:hypothetical protein
MTMRRSTPIAFALAAYITVYGLIGPIPHGPAVPKTVTSPLLHLVLSYLTKVVRSVRWLPNFVRCRALKWRIETFGVRIRSDGRWYGRGRSGIVGSRYQTAVGGALAPVTFDKALPIGQLATLPTVAASLSANGGGTIYISGPGTYHATATIAMAANGAVANVDVYFSTGAKVVIDASLAAGFPTHINATVSYTKLFDWSNCSNCNIYNCTAYDYLVSTGSGASVSNSVVCHYIGGNANTLRFYDCYANGFTRWHTMVTGYSSGVAGLGTQDGPVSDIIIVRPRGVNLGNTTTPDGGGVKIGNNTGVALPFSTVGNIHVLEPSWTGIAFSFFDVTPSSPSSASVGTVVNGNYSIEGGQGTMLLNNTGNCFGIFIENAVGWTSAQLAERDIRIRNFQCDMNGASSGIAAIFIANTANNVLIDGCTFKNCPSGYGIKLTGRTNASPALAATHGRGYRIKNSTVVNCGTGILVDATVGESGTVLDGVEFDGVLLDDNGQGNMTTGLAIHTSSTNRLRNARFRGIDATHIAVGGTPLSILSSASADPMEPSIQFERCPGITPLGVLSNTTGPTGPVVNTAKNFIAPYGDAVATSPTTGTTYYVSSKAGASVAATGGTRTALSITDARGFPLQAFSQMSKASGASATPTNGITYTVLNEDMTVTTTGGTGTSYVVQDFAGNYLNPSGASGDAQLTAQFVPNGGTIGVTQSSAGTWTVVGSTNGAIADPFLDSMSGVTIPAVWVEYGGSVTETSSGAATWTVKMPMQTGVTVNAAVATVASPFVQYRNVGDPYALQGGGTNVVTTAKAYRFGMDMNVDWDLTTAPAITVRDQYGNIIDTPLDATATHVVLHIKAGQMVTATFTTLTSAVYSDDSG